MTAPALVSTAARLGVPVWRHVFDVSSAGEFLERFTDLYLDSFLTNVAVGVLLGALGLFVILRRMVFLSAALSQVAGAGLALAFFLGALLAHEAGQLQPAPKAAPDEVLDRHVPTDDADKEIQGFLDDDGPPGGAPAPRPRPRRAPTEAPAMAATPSPAMAPAQLKGEVPGTFRHGRHAPISPLVLSLLITVAIALLISRLPGGKWRSTRESVVGLVFIVASGASILLAQLAEKGAHEIAEFLFGTVIFIPPDQQRLVYLTALGTLAIYGWLFKDFVFVSFDPTAARAGHYPVWLANGTLFVLIAVAIAVTTRAVGAMPVFALTVLPPAAALQLHDRLGPAVFTSGLIGAVAAAGGYFLSGLLNLSAGPLIVLVAALGVGVTASLRFALNRIRAHRARRRSASGKETRHD